MVEVSNNFIQECEANVGTYKFGKIKVNYIDDNPFNYEQGAYSSSNGAKIDAEQSIRYNKLVECKPNFKYKIELGNSAYKMKIVTYNANQAFIAAHDNLIQGSELTTESTAAYISVTIYSNDTLEGTNITLNNTIRNGEILGAELKGNTTQNGTPTPSSPVPVNNVTGLQTIGIGEKNLFKPTLGTTTINGVTFTKNNDGTYTANGTASAFIGLEIGQFIFGSAKTITYSGAPSNASMSTYSFNLMKIIGGTKTWLQDELGTGKTITTESNVVYSVMLVIRSGVSVSNVVFKPMIELGNAKTEFEPFNGKQYEINLGKNLLEPKMATATLNGITCTNNGDGSFTLNGTATANATFRLNQSTYNGTDNLKHYSGTYTLSCNELQTDMRLIVMQNQTWASLLHLVNTKSTTATFDKQNCFIYVQVDNGKTVDNLTIRPMLEKGSVATSYSPYFTPIELNKIGNYQDFIRKGIGNNLINVSNGTVTTNGVTGSWNNNFVQISGTNTKTDANWILLSTANFDFPDFKIGETYTISALGKTNKCYVQINYNVGDTTTQKALVTMSEDSKSFTVPEDFGRINFIFVGIYRTTGAINENWYLQLNKGPATSYEPYGYKDKWYIEKNVGKVVLNGSENGGSMVDNNQRIMFSSYNIPILSNVYIANPSSVSNLTPSLCNHFLPSFQNDLKPSNTKFAFSKWADTIYIYFSAIVDNVADFKTWLNTHNTSVYYVLNTPEYTLIENEELIEQLDALSHAKTQEGTTNIISSGILPAILEVTPNLIESIRGKQTTPIVGYNITGDDDLINFKITSKADSNGNILGATSQSQVDIEIFNENNTHNLENKQVYISTGLNETEGNYCKWQPFTITQTKDTQTKNHTTYTGYDDMMRGNGAYIDNVDYGEEGITLYDFTCKLAKEMGMALGNTTMTNGDFIVKGNNFTNNETKLVVLKNVAQMAGGFAMIDRDNLLRIVELSPEEAMTPIELTTNLYTEDFQNSAKFGEINEFAIGETNIETNAIVRSDDASIAKNGVKKIEILDNMFLGLLEDKETAIEPLWDAFNGFSYYPFKTPYNGYPYIDLGDKINITDINSNVYSTLVLNNVFEYNGGYKGNIGAEALSITAAKYKTNNTLGKQFRKVGIEIDRVEGKITSEIAAATDGITNAYNTAISQTEKNINLSVTEINKVLSGDPAVEGDTGLEGTVNKINQTYLTVDSNAFTVVSSTATEAKKKADAVEENTQKIVSQLHFDAETGLTISAEGSTDDDMKLNLTNSQVNFMYRNSPVLVINGNKIEFTGATFQKFDLGNYVWQAEDDDSLSLIYEGD